MSGIDQAITSEAVDLGAGIAVHDSMRWRPVVTVEKYHGDDLTAEPYETITAPGNLLTTAGLNRLTSLMIGAGGQAATNTATRLGVGNSATAAAVGQTDLQAAAAVSGAPWSTTGRKNVVPAGTGGPRDIGISPPSPLTAINPSITDRRLTAAQAAQGDGLGDFKTKMEGVLTSTVDGFAAATAAAIDSGEAWDEAMGKMLRAALKSLVQQSSKSRHFVGCLACRSSRQGRLPLHG